MFNRGSTGGVKQMSMRGSLKMVVCIGFMGGVIWGMAQFLEIMN
ncbi:hypothetical protein BUBS_278 [Bacillus phage Bubs]|uniref:Uncharacterized protein n=1 Tax=Bacillus phage PPIsBest TaxID=2024234 RepID=A0A222Z4E0_9CAUD|nr:hypothetical protein BIZ89_gp278 [Bacillus phage Kida]YP_009280644.1 hypothetical protein BI039_gp105 [Bacillus phage Belinda]ASR78455.1 hypothetical protein PPISBEST_275 [Bacillus phage PPIsBest]ASR78547.1 hypothetical protein BUBS_278 [Bacillus phage Bubs]ASR78904.1 hypothetical protein AARONPHADGERS_279 [Bacillus phage AaronPhadgers]AUV57904.1 hypothetical protein HONESTABE_267 [Bacillus phage HonestAbe]UGO46520.1 hypothetical protein ABINADI_203 [Bacillus phage vB_BanH_Abinadi]ULF4947